MLLLKLAQFLDPIFPYARSGKAIEPDGFHAIDPFFLQLISFVIVYRPIVTNPQSQMGVFRASFWDVRVAVFLLEIHEFLEGFHRRQSVHAYPLKSKR